MRDSDNKCLSSSHADISSVICEETEQKAHSYFDTQHPKIHTSTSSNPFTCSQPECGRKFSSKFKMMRHMLIHSTERQFKCSICERCFHRKDHLKNHLQVHNPNKTVHSCDHCGKKYSSFLSYRKHLALHAAEAGDLSCKLCGKVFSEKAEIMYHLKVHSGSRAVKGPNERKFKCDQCDRSFFTRKDVKRHMVVHTGVRNFLCHYCPQRFGRKDHLVRHIKKSHAGSVLPAGTLVKEATLPDAKGEQSCSLPLSDVASTSSQTNFTEVHTPVDASTLVSVKQEPGVSTTSSYDGSLYPSANVGSLPGEQTDVLKVGELIPLPVPEYISLASAFNSGMSPFFSNACYLSQVGTTNVLPLPSQGILPSISGTGLTPFSTTSDTSNASLPHFNQAF